MGATVAGDIDTSAIEWTGTTDIEADEALAAQAAKYSAPKKHDAEIFIRNLLLDGPVSVDDVYEQAEREGIARRTIRRAYDDLSIWDLVVGLGGTAGRQVSSASGRPDRYRHYRGTVMVGGDPTEATNTTISQAPSLPGDGFMLSNL